MKPLLLTFDVEEFDWLVDGARPMPPAEQIAITAEGLRLLIPILQNSRARATFFVTGTFAESQGELVAQLADSGHEIGVHGLEHGDDYASLDPGEATGRLLRAREIVEGASGQTASGLRTPRLRKCPATVVREAGFAYDASPHPTWVPGRYFGLLLSRKPWQEESITMVPISVLPVLRTPVSWQWFQIAGRGLGVAALRLAALGAPYLHLYFHPWEAIDLRSVGIDTPVTRRTGPPFLEAMTAILARTSGWTETTTVIDFIKR